MKDTVAPIEGGLYAFVNVRVVSTPFVVVLTTESLSYKALRSTSNCRPSVAMAILGFCTLSAMSTTRPNVRIFAPIYLFGLVRRSSRGTGIAAIDNNTEQWHTARMRFVL